MSHSGKPHQSGETALQYRLRNIVQTHSHELLAALGEYLKKDNPMTNSSDPDIKEAVEHLKKACDAMERHREKIKAQAAEQAKPATQEP